MARMVMGLLVSLDEFVILLKSESVCACFSEEIHYSVKV